MAADAAIVADKLERSFGDEVVVNGVDLSVPKGEVFACVGAPGAGRSPLIRMLCGLLTPTGGKAKVAGFDIVAQAADVRRRVGAVMPGMSFDPKVTGQEALRFLGRLYGLSGAGLDSRVAITMEAVRLDKSTVVGPFGECEPPAKRRIELAAALLHGPQILFLDEVTVGLDPDDRTAFLHDLRDLQRALGLTVFLATQASAEADQVADRVAIIYRGRVVAEGTLADLKGAVGSELIALRVQGPADAAARVARLVGGVKEVVVNGPEITVLAANSGAILTPLAAALSDAGIAITELSLRRSTLDDVFLELTGVRLEGLGGRATMTFPAKK